MRGFMSVKYLIRPILVASLFLFAFSMRGEKLKKLELTAVKESPVKVDDTEAYDNLHRLVTVMKLLQKLYVDPEKVSMRKLVDGALKGMLHELDPYSSYEPFQNKKFGRKSKLVGIGIMGIKRKRSGFKVICTLKKSPAAKAGIKVRDLIVKIDGKPVGNLNYQQCRNLLRGIAGSKVKIELLREGNNNPLFFQITRSSFEQKAIELKDIKILKNNIGYIRINSFEKKTVLFLDKALKVLKKKNCQGIILDLRNNPGGLVKAAVALCSRFLEKDKLVITIEGRDLKNIQKILAQNCIKYTKLPLLILINRFSASASEIVAGCMKDHKRAILLGSKTFGKGSVQRVCKIKNNGTLRFTVAKYYTPAHNIIHGKGIEPHINVSLSLKDRLHLAEQLERSPGIIYPTKKGMLKDIQLQRAEQVLTGILKLRGEKND
jgi:carboxyl-terminal processing protease